MKSVIAYTGAFVVAVVIVAICILIAGILFKELWNFVAPVYWSESPQLTLVQAIATLALLYLAKGPDLSNKKK